ncbi:protein CRABS CLAW [Cornus florida]|uniref:protein CRABS CLAW n=1 Tax=Cornus florida TaxID=4283 RepID=UPI00289875E3|nr:protein CRABS CLAW [Cornus florida]
MGSSSNKLSMDLAPPSEHLCYVRCNFCNTVLAVGIPFKRLLDTVTVKCGHCSNLSFLSTRPPLQGQFLDHHQTNLQGFCCEIKKGQSSSSSSSSTSSEPLSPRPPFVVKPPEKKHRLPSAYNRFMKDEIQRIKAANPEIPHREAFSAAAKNWARYIPNSPTGSISESNKNVRTHTDTILNAKTLFILFNFLNIYIYSHDAEQLETGMLDSLLLSFALALLTFNPFHLVYIVLSGCRELVEAEDDLLEAEVREMPFKAVQAAA